MHENHLIQGKAAALRIDNLDTDQIMPKQFLRGIDKSGLAAGLLYDLRHDSAGLRRDTFVLNQPAYAAARILIAGSNFGCGSSREHAVWGLLQYGIQAIIAPSFGEIFYSNAMGNRLLLVTLQAEEVETLMKLSGQPDAPDLVVDALSRTVQCAGLPPMPFALSERHRQMFLQGTDLIGVSMGYGEEIKAFAADHWQRRPWLRDVAARMKSRLPQN
jgi:3-isopropylmalate/(R)-2-methylmalate dehydratase small subunit